MKRLFIAGLCLLFASLYACGKVTLPEETTTTTTMAETTKIPTTTIAFKPNPDDPYSYVIADALEESGNWLADRVWRYEDYVLYDTDGKGTMALLLGWENSEGFICEIFTLRNGVAERKFSIPDGSNDHVIRMMKTGYIYTEDLHGAGTTRGYYCFEDGQLRLAAGLGGYEDVSGYFRVDPTDGERDFFFGFVPDGTEVPINDEECRRLVKEFVGDWEPAELDWKPLAEYGR